MGREYPHLESSCLASALVEAADRFSFVEAVISPRCATRKKSPARDLRLTAFLYRFVPTASNPSRQRPPPRFFPAAVEGTPDQPMPNDNLSNGLGQGSSLQRQASYRGAGVLPAARSPEPRPACAGVRNSPQTAASLWQRRPGRLDVRLDLLWSLFGKTSREQASSSHHP